MGTRESARDSRETAVLFAGIVGTGGGAAQEAFARLADMLGHAAQRSSGRLASRLDREVMALFATPDAAVRAAVRLHAYAVTLPNSPANLGMRIGLHYGPVAQRGQEIFGDTVKRALALVQAAGAGEALISQRAAAVLGPRMQRFVSPLPSDDGKGAGELRLGELVFRKEADLAAQRSAHLRLRLGYRAKSIERRREGDAATIGRDASCDLAVEDSDASTQHCTIYRRNGACVLKDHSANGTFVTAEGGLPLAVRGEEIPLYGRGIISFGRPGIAAQEAVQYSCEG